MTNTRLNTNKLYSWINFLGFLSITGVLLQGSIVEAGVFRRVPRPISDQYIVVYYGQPKGENDRDLDDQVGRVTHEHGATNEFSIYDTKTRCGNYEERPG